MAYIDELLGRDEKVLFVAQQHPFTLISNILAELLLIALLVLAGIFSQRAFAGSTATISGIPIVSLILPICVIIALGLVVSAVRDYMIWSNRQFVITDQRVIQIEGVLNKEVGDSSLEKINDLELRQSWIGRIFNYGDIEVLTGADAGVNLIHNIAAPLDFKRTLLEAKHNLSRGFGYLDAQQVAAYTQPAEARLSPDDVQQMLLKLTGMRDSGLISPEEFAEKRRDILARM